MVGHGAMHGLGSGRPQWQKDQDAKSKFELESALSEFRQAAARQDREKAEDAAMTLCGGIKRPISGEVDTRKLVRASAELDVRGKSLDGVPVKIPVFDGTFDEKGMPGTVELTYNTSPETATAMAKQFLGQPDRNNNGPVTVHMEQINNGTVPKCISRRHGQPSPSQAYWMSRDTPVHVSQDGMLAGQTSGHVPYWDVSRDAYGGSGPIALAVPGSTQPFLCADVAAADASRALQIGTVVGNCNMSMSDWLGSNKLGFGAEKQPNMSEAGIGMTRDKARDAVRDVLDRIDQNRERLEALGIRTASSYADGVECTAVYLDLNSGAGSMGSVDKALEALSEVCGGGSDLGPVRDFRLMPTGVDAFMGVSGKDPDGRTHTVVPISFTSSANIGAFPMQINYAQLAAESGPDELGISLAGLTYSPAVLDMAGKAVEGAMDGAGRERLREAVISDGPSAVASAFGLEDAVSLAGRVTPVFRMGRMAGPTEHMVDSRARELNDRLTDVRSALEKGGVDVKPGMTWTEIGTAGGPEAFRMSRF